MLKKYNNRFLNIIIVSFIIFGIFIPSFYHTIFINDSYSNQFVDNINDINIKASNNHMFEGNIDPLNITDFGKLYNNSQSISLTNEEEYNLPYFIDTVHDWNASKIENSITNIQDTRDWVYENDFYELDAPYIRYVSIDSAHNYSADLDDLPTIPANVHDNITEIGAAAIRIHFTQIEFQFNIDLLCIYDGVFDLKTAFTGSDSDFYTPWLAAETLLLTVTSDSSIEWYGYQIDYYEFYNESTNYYNYQSYWDFNNEDTWNPANFGPGDIGGNTAMYATLLAYPYRTEGKLAAYYWEGDFAEIYQNITIPRGEVIGGYISFDYYAESAMRSNENYIYCEINNEKIYSKGLRDIVNANRTTWHNTGKINMDLWINNTEIFNNIQNNQDINISIGVMSGASVSYTGFEDRFEQIFWFDNISLELTTLANSSQSGIDLKFGASGSLVDLIEGAEWGNSNRDFEGLWGELNPLILTINTSSPSLSFDLNTFIYGYHNGTSKINQQNNKGLLYTILNNGTVIWDFYHNFYMPPLYTEFEFKVDKPLNWEILSILDPTFLSVPFEAGNIGDSYVKIGSSDAKYPGWWKITATSPNYIDIVNTEVSKNGDWGENGFLTGDIAQIRTQINYSDEIPPNLDSTIANLTIYDIEGNIWHQESQIPNLADGIVLFSEIDFSTMNTTYGGIYNYTIFWTNGTAIGGVKSSLTIVHDSYLTLLEPDHAQEDLIASGKVGDYIPVRIFARDSENNNSLSQGIVSYNWSIGLGPIIKYMDETVSGIYDAILDTDDLGARGLYHIVIQINLSGYVSSNLTLGINLGEDTSLQRLQSDSQIIINSNSTIEFFYAGYEEVGITGATLTINISNPIYYSTRELGEGNYEVEINTTFIAATGIYILEFTFNAPGYEEQIHLYQFTIIDPPSTSVGPNILLLSILAIAVAIIGGLSILSLRTYVLLPRRRRKESDILAKTQRFKDLKNIQAIVIIDKLSGVPILSKSYSILETHKKELFSGFIQAITTIGEQIADKKTLKSSKEAKMQTSKRDRLLELDFKYFYCLICDIEDIRVVLVLKEKASERLKTQIRRLSEALTLQISEHLQNWDGSINKFEILIPPILEDYIEMYYKESFNLNNPKQVGKMKREGQLNSMQTRVLNVIDSIAKYRSDFYLEYVLNSIHESNKDKVVIALESLIEKKIIIPKSVDKDYMKYT
ncbi:MAG: hypothetical protein KGD63_08605 [Candidatus Lokiarchaeota archaeon]|nr:hypothetical protein [Candidatus Lokiarchaeota archaeon]